MSRQIKGGLTVAALVLVPLLAVAAGDAFRAALDFTTGVLSLLSLTAAVAWGLIATDRLLLSPRHRLLAQGVHRATAVASLGFLVLHVTVKVTLGHVALIGALVPFGLGVSGTDGLIGLGSLAGLLMIVAATTGALRSAFAVPGRIAGRWRATHMLAYPAWCFALMHGLYAGRAPATWVTTMYCLSLVGVASAVSLRLLPRPLQRRVADRIAVLTGAVRETPAAERTRRDPSADPLPGATGPAPETEYDQWLQREPAMSARTTARRLGGPRTPPRLAAPAPPLYEAARPAADTFPGTFTGTGTGTGRPDDPDTGPFPGAGADPVPGPGIAAGYRAVSLAGDPGNDRTARIPVTPPPTGEIPLAERIPMTEELPVVSNEPTGRPGSWPAPSPPVPAQAFAPPAPPLYDSGAVPPYDSGATPAYDTGALPPRHATTSPYDTGAVPAYGPDAPSPYDTGAVPVQDGRTPASAPPSPSGPLYPPPAGEPWHAPAGDRP
ncbi:hypothetical protein [Streptomyces sp. AK02-01A]|uniref:hypothetical protein n=1 Tax=Streptomyces sp. AK02-01A TaxID=3028648 RepID=UPI0029B9F9F8|nr:hypothetical protein [Streptomyces sp. AK02-01A]MDX3849370.1 hypothetical protein [Streptomyces sp. AK02-01A]